MIKISDKINWSDIGNEVRSAINESLRTGDFSKLGSTFSDTVSDALNNLFGSLQSQDSGAYRQNPAGSRYSGSAKPSQCQTYYVPKEDTFTAKWIRENQAKKQEEERRRMELEMARPLQGIAIDPPFKRIGRISGVLYSTFGGIGIGLSLISIAAFRLVIAVTGAGLSGLKFSGWMLLGSLIMTVFGGIKCKRFSKAKKYYSICRAKRYCNVDEIALRMNTSIKSALKDIKKLLRIGFFPQGHLSKDNSCLMLDDRIYNEYLEIEKQRRLQIEAAAAPSVAAAPAAEAAQPAGEESLAMPSTGDSELDAMIKEGESCIKRLRKMNDNIPGEEISLKLTRLENLLSEIFERLKEHPEQKGQMHKFMDYYLPMTLKLVAAYEEFDSLSVQGEDIAEAKAEIEKTLDAINDAFKELLIRLYKDAAFDAATDAQVLKTMLAKEGLTREQPFSQNTPKDKL